MRLSTLAQLLGVTQLVASATADISKGPFTSEYRRYCPSGTLDGTVQIDGVEFTYYCDSAQSVGQSLQLKTSSPQNCGSVCINDDDCEVVVWDRNIGECWVGQPVGQRTRQVGRLVLARVTNSGGSADLANCQASLDRYKPGDPICDANNKGITEVNSQRFYLACGLVPSGLNADSGTYKDMAACLQRCTDVLGCQFVVHHPATSRCFLGKYDFPLSKPHADGAWNSAFMVER